MKGSTLAKAPMSCAAGVLLIVGLLAGCATSHVQNVTLSREAGRQRFSTLLVIGVAQRPENRQIYEDALVRQLQAAGVSGVASYTLLPDAQMTDRAAIRQAAVRSGADGILVTRLTRITRQVETLPPSMSMEDYVGTSMPEGYEPTQLQTDIATLKVSLFDAGTRQAVWSSAVQVSAGSLREGISSASKTIVKQLAKDNLL